MIPILAIGAKKKPFISHLSSNFPIADWIQMACSTAQRVEGHLSGRCEEEEIDHSRGLRRSEAWG